MSRKVDYIKKHHLSYIFYRLKGQGFSYKEISDIVEAYQSKLAEDIALGISVKFNKGIGSLQLSKIKRGVSINDEGEVVNTMPIAIGKTLALWDKHPEHKNKTYVRYMNEHSNGYMFCLSFRVKTATFKLKSYYTFRKNRGLTAKLSENIKNNKVDALIKTEY